MILDICLGGLAHRGVGLDRIAQIAQALGNAIGVNHPACLTTVNTKEHQILDERLDAQGHKVHRLDAHAVVENDIGMLLNGSLDVCRQRNCRYVVRSHIIERRNRIGRVAALRNGNVERVLRIGVLEIDKGLGRHDGHLHLQCVL